MKLRKLLFALLAMITLLSCGDKEEVKLVTLSNAEGVIVGKGGSADFKITTQADWTVKNEASWITVTPSEGRGDATIKVTATLNDTEEPRESVLFINEQSYKVIQTIGKDIGDITGIWNAPGFKFDFKKDLSCLATVRGTDYVGTYTISEDIITVSVDKMNIVIIVNSVSTTDGKTTMEASSFGQKLTLTKE